MRCRKNERNHSPIEINGNTHCTPVRTGFQATCIGKCMSPASLKRFHLQEFLTSYVERILNIVLVYYCSVVCLGVNLTTNLYNDEVPNSKDDQSTVFKKLKERKVFLQNWVSRRFSDRSPFRETCFIQPHQHQNHNFCPSPFLKSCKQSHIFFSSSRRSPILQFLCWNFP